MVGIQRFFSRIYVLSRCEERLCVRFNLDSCEQEVLSTSMFNGKVNGVSKMFPRT